LYCWIPQLIEAIDLPERVKPREDAENTALGKQEIKIGAAKTKAGRLPDPPE